MTSLENSNEGFALREMLGKILPLSFFTQARTGMRSKSRPPCSKALSVITRVMAVEGIKVQEYPSLDSKVLGTIPFRKSFWIRKEYSKPFTVEGKKAKWLFADASFGHDAIRKPHPRVQGWILDTQPGELLMPLPDGLKNFKAGCLYGCNICGAVVFDPDGFFLRSFDCHQSPETGRWSLIGERIAACIVFKCNPKNETPSRYNYEINSSGEFSKTQNRQIKPMRTKMMYWEPGGWATLQERNHSLLLL